MRANNSNLDRLRRLEPTDAWLANLVAQGGEVVRAGAFVAVIGPNGGHGFTYAAPIETAGEDDDAAAGLRELRRVFQQRGLELSVEFNAPLFPDLPDLLEREGFTLEEREPLLLCTPSDFRPFVAPDVDVQFLSSGGDDDGLIAYQSIFSEVLLERPFQAPPEAIASLRSEIARCGDRCHALARVRGEPVGTGFISSLDGVCEITRVATLPPARRRGVAATVTSFMVGGRFSHGGDTLAWLTASGEPARALYRKLGFQPAGARLYYRAG